MADLATSDKGKVKLREELASIRKEANGLNLQTEKGARKLAQRIDGNTQGWLLAFIESILGD